MLNQYKKLSKKLKNLNRGTADSEHQCYEQSKKQFRVFVQEQQDQRSATRLHRHYDRGF